MTIDYEAEAAEDAEKINSAKLQNISRLAKKQLDHEAEIARLEGLLKLAKKQLAKIQEKELPEAMTEAGCKSFVLEDGSSIEIKDGITASLTEGKKPGAIAWLVENNYSRIISDTVEVSFSVGSEEQVKEVVETLQEHGCIPVVRRNVNTATLKSLINELRKSGKDVPLEVLGAYEWKKSYVDSKKPASK